MTCEVQMEGRKWKAEWTRCRKVRSVLV